MEKDDTPNKHNEDLARRVDLGLVEIEAYRLDTPRLNRGKRAHQEALRKQANTLREAFDISIEGILKDIGSLQARHTTRVGEIKQDPPATSNFIRGALAGGSAGYVLSFFAAKALTMAFVHAGDKDRWAFAPLAGILHATAGEIVGGGLRSTYATYESPDGKLWADFISAMSNYALFAIGGNAKGRTQARKDMGAAIRNIQKSLDDRLGKDRKRSRAIALFGAWWRSLVCDELAFVAFAVTYVVTGGVQPILRRMEDKAMSAAIDFSATLACGLVGASLTGVLQNLMRQCYQRAAFKTGANHNAERVATQDLLAQTIAALERERAKVETTRDKFMSLFYAVDDPKTQEMHQAIGDEAQKTLQHIDQTLTTYRRELLKLEEKEGLAVVAKAIKNTAKSLFCGPAVATTPWVGSVAKVRRVSAKCIGNTAAVAAYLYYMSVVSNSLFPLQSTEMGNQTAPTMGNSTHVPPIATMELVDYAMHGFVLIGSWCARSLVSNAMETIALPIAVGTPMRILNANSALCRWITGGSATVPAQAANEEPSGDSDSSSISEENNGEGVDSSQGNQDEDSSGEGYYSNHRSQDGDPVSNARDELAAHRNVVIDLKKILESTSSDEGNDDTDPDEDGEEPDADEDKEGSSSDGVSDS